MPHIIEDFTKILITLNKAKYLDAKINIFGGKNSSLYSFEAAPFEKMSQKNLKFSFYHITIFLKISFVSGPYTISILEKIS